MLYNFAADSFYIMKLCSRLFVLHCRSRPKYDRSRQFDPHFEEVGGGVEPWWMARWKALVEFLLSVITGSIARSANLSVFSLLRGRFSGFSQHRGDTLHRWGEICHAKFHPHRCNDKGVGPPKLKFLLRFDRNLEHKRPARAYPLRDVHKICRVCTSFPGALGVKIWICSRGYGVMGV